MAKRKEKELALKLREQGKTYSEIKECISVSKGTLSLWLRDKPLSDERMREVRDFSEKRIENYRNTMRQKREKVLLRAYCIAKQDIGKLSRRDIFIAGLFLYWGEGSKQDCAEIGLSNTDPAVLKFFLKWLNVLSVPKNRLRIRLQLYSDMCIEKEKQYWSRELKISKSQFRKPYIKKSKLSDITHRQGGFGHGTCVILYGSREINDYVLQSMEYLRKTVE
ncbi:MAG: hypothetical protein JKX80_02360 [Candidatus Pacebacteria bacterium]|nr:hypothetical protein [Candidatus Paceibacterota bacterium]